MASNGKRLGFLPGWRKGTYIILIFNILMLIWVIGGASSTSGNAKDCGSLSQDTCNAARDAGAGIGIFILIVLWALGDIILGVIWLVTNRKKGRDCPACGHTVKNGLFQCGKCGYDFRAAAMGIPVASAASPAAAMTMPTPTAPPAAPAPASVPAGWYADPHGVAGQQRYWDGTTWTDHVHPGTS